MTLRGVLIAIFVFLAAREHIEKRPALDWLVRRLGVAVKVDRGALAQREVLRSAGAVLADGASLVLFPEGRINVPSETGVALLPLEPGAAVIARRAGVPIVPMMIAGSDDLTFGRRIAIAFGEPIPPGAGRVDDDRTLGSLAAALTSLPATPPPPRIRIGRWLGRLR